MNLSKLVSSGMSPTSFRKATYMHTYFSPPLQPVTEKFFSMSEEEGDPLMCVGEPQKQREQPEPGDGDTQMPHKLLGWVFTSHPHNSQLLGRTWSLICSSTS